MTDRWTVENGEPLYDGFDDFDSLDPETKAALVALIEDNERLGQALGQAEDDLAALDAKHEETVKEHRIAYAVGEWCAAERDAERAKVAEAEATIADLRMIVAGMRECEDTLRAALNAEWAKVAEAVALIDAIQRLRSGSLGIVTYQDLYRWADANREAT